MTFIEFARACGVVIDDYPPVGRWVRLPTVDKPKHRNGAVKWLVDHGFVQNHATQTEVSVWREESSKPIDHAAIARQAGQVRDEIEAKQKRAAGKADWILSQCELTTHPYLAAKGFPKEIANVWQDEKAGDLKLCIPMRVEGRIVGMQTISDQPAHQRQDRDGRTVDVPAFEKKFLYGQRTSDAAFVIDNRGPAVLCEGYATALSCRMALTALRARYTLFVCFSAHNLGRIAAALPKGLIVADNDASGTGERVARESGWPYFMSTVVGDDFNDFAVRVGLFKSSQSLRSALLSTS